MQGEQSWRAHPRQLQGRHKLLLAAVPVRRATPEASWCLSGEVSPPASTAWAGLACRREVAYAPVPGRLVNE